MRWPIRSIKSPTDGTRYRTTINLPFGYRINIFWRPDDRPDYHDHPMDFSTFPIKGYWERVSVPLGVGTLKAVHPDGMERELGTVKDLRMTSVRYVAPFRWHHRDADYRHVLLGSQRRLVGDDLVYGGGFISIVREGMSYRVWGFYPDGKFVFWRDYLNMLSRRKRFEDEL
jgi:hypothetical protein